MYSKRKEKLGVRLVSSDAPPQHHDAMDKIDQLLAAAEVSLAHERSKKSAPSHTTSQPPSPGQPHHHHHHHHQHTAAVTASPSSHFGSEKARAVASEITLHSHDLKGRLVASSVASLPAVRGAQQAVAPEFHGLLPPQDSAFPSSASSSALFTVSGDPMSILRDCIKHFLAHPDTYGTNIRASLQSELDYVLKIWALSPVNFQQPQQQLPQHGTSSSPPEFRNLIQDNFFDRAVRQAKEQQEAARRDLSWMEEDHGMMMGGFGGGGTYGAEYDAASGAPRAAHHSSNADRGPTLSILPPSSTSTSRPPLYPPNMVATEPPTPHQVPHRLLLSAGSGNVGGPGSAATFAIHPMYPHETVAAAATHEVNELRRQLRAIATESADRSTTIAVEQAERNNMLLEIRRLESLIKKQETTITLQRQEHEAMEGELTKLRIVLNEHAMRGSHYQEQEERKRLDVEAQLKESKAEITAMYSTWRATQRSLEIAQKDADSATTECDKLREQLDLLTAQHERAKRMIGRRNKSILLHQRLLQRRRETIGVLQQCVKELESFAGTGTLVDMFVQADSAWSSFLFYKLHRYVHHVAPNSNSSVAPILHTAALLDCEGTLFVASSEGGACVMGQFSIDQLQSMVQRMNRPFQALLLTSAASHPSDTNDTLLGGAQLLLLSSFMQSSDTVADNSFRVSSVKSSMPLFCDALRWDQPFAVDYYGESLLESLSRMPDPSQRTAALKEYQKKGRRQYEIGSALSMILPHTNQGGGGADTLGTATFASATAVSIAFDPSSALSPSLTNNDPSILFDNGLQLRRCDARLILYGLWKERYQEYMAFYMASKEVEQRNRNNASGTHGDTVTIHSATGDLTPPGSFLTFLYRYLVKHFDESSVVLKKKGVGSNVFQRKKSRSMSSAMPEQPTVGVPPAGTAQGSTVADDDVPPGSGDIRFFQDDAKHAYCVEQLPPRLKTGQRSRRAVVLNAVAREALTALLQFAMEYKETDADFRLFYLVAHQLMPEAVAINFYAMTESIFMECDQVVVKSVVQSNEGGGGGSGSSSSANRRAPESQYYYDGVGRSTAIAADGRNPPPVSPSTATTTGTHITAQLQEELPFVPLEYRHGQHGGEGDGMNGSINIQEESSSEDDEATINNYITLGGSSSPRKTPASGGGGGTAGSAHSAPIKAKADDSTSSSERRIKNSERLCRNGLLSLHEFLRIVERNAFASYRLVKNALKPHEDDEHSVLFTIGEGANPSSPLDRVGYVPLTPIQAQRLKFAVSLDQASPVVKYAALFQMDSTAGRPSHFYDELLTLVLDHHAAIQEALVHDVVLPSCTCRAKRGYGRESSPPVTSIDVDDTSNSSHSNGHTSLCEGEVSVAALTQRLELFVANMSSPFGTVKNAETMNTIMNQNHLKNNNNGKASDPRRSVCFVGGAATQSLNPASPPSPPPPGSSAGSRYRHHTSSTDDPHTANRPAPPSEGEQEPQLSLEDLIAKERRATSAIIAQRIALQLAEECPKDSMELMEKQFADCSVLVPNPTLNSAMIGDMFCPDGGTFFMRPLIQTAPQQDMVQSGLKRYQTLPLLLLVARLRVTMFFFESMTLSQEDDAKAGGKKDNHNGSAAAASSSGGAVGSSENRLVPIGESGSTKLAVPFHLVSPEMLLAFREEMHRACDECDQRMTKQRALHNPFRKSLPAPFPGSSSGIVPPAQNNNGLSGLAARKRKGTLAKSINLSSVGTSSIHQTSLFDPPATNTFETLYKPVGASSSNSNGEGASTSALAVVSEAAAAVTAAASHWTKATKRSAQSTLTEIQTTRLVPLEVGILSLLRRRINPQLGPQALPVADLAEYHTLMMEALLKPVDDATISAEERYAMYGRARPGATTQQPRGGGTSDAAAAKAAVLQRRQSNLRASFSLLLGSSNNSSNTNEEHKTGRAFARGLDDDANSAHGPLSPSNIPTTRRRVGSIAMGLHAIM